MLKASQKPHEASAFARALDVERARHDRRLIRHDAHGVSSVARKSHDDVAAVELVDLEELAVVNRAFG